MNEMASAWVQAKNGIAFVYALSGFRMKAPDHDAFSVHIEYPPATTILGAVVRQALEASRLVDSTKVGKAAWERFMFEDARRRNDAWLEDALRVTGVKSEKDFLAESQGCSLLRIGDRVRLTPTFDGNIGGWRSDQALADAVRYFPVNASNELIQAVVVESLSLAS